MMYLKVIVSLLIIISITDSIHGSYHYVGCYSQVFHDSSFTSSFMEPTLCFRLCDTQIIYLQKTKCRCSGGGLMHHNRQSDKNCNIPCTKPADRQVKTENTCGGAITYSAYVEEQFYSRHGHLFNYQIIFFSCELWKTSNVYDTFQVKLDEIIDKSSLNKMELCAAACLDKNTTTKSIAFNDDDNQCVCIMPWKSDTPFQRTHYLTILPNTSCNRYCNNPSDESITEHKFQCGSTNDTRVWAIYDLNGTCPTDFVYIKELKKCLYTYKNIWNSCSPPSKSFVYDESITWSIFSQMIEKLKLNESTVTIDFDEDVIINSSWKCASNITNTVNSYGYGYGYNSRSTYFSGNSNTRYLLDNGCLRDSTYSLYSHTFSYRLCITNPINKYSIPYDDDDDDDEKNSTYITAINPQIKFCPTNWFDLNERCYRMSDERKTIQDARQSCISISTESSKNDKSHSWIYDDDDDDEESQLNVAPKGDIVQYSSQWQTRLGFFLLDTTPEHDEQNPPESATQLLSLYYGEGLISSGSSDHSYHSRINEFQMIIPTELNESNQTDNSCTIATRTIVEENERPILKTNQMNNCSKARHVFCETKTLIVRNFQYGCFRKPITLDLPALISNRLTYELCLSVCQELQTKFAIIHINKCYCVKGVNSKVFNITADFAKYQQKTCGDPCSGNQHEPCGNADTIVVFHILDSRRTYTDAGTPAEAFPDFTYDSCVQLSSFNPSTTYQFTLTNSHPRHCLSLCTNYQQKYALMNSNKCLCTNIPIKDEEDDIDLLPREVCSQQCQANYFYSCGNELDSTIYSMYIMQPKCRHGFEVAENDQQCVYSHLSAKTNSFLSAQSYCQSIDSNIAKINDILEIQDILPESILNIRILKLYPVLLHLKIVNDTQYFWINRTIDIPDNYTISDRLLDKCSQTSDIIDRNCIVVRREKNLNDSRISDERCIAESNQCSVMSAIPVCVDQHLESNSTFISPITDESSTKVSVNISVDYSCDDEYHFVDDYCYKISFHEVSWNDARAECQRDYAMLFVPEKSITLQIIKSLFLRRTSYTPSGFAHVGVMYDNQNRTVIQYNTTNENTVRTVPDSNAVYDLCEKTFYERYSALMLSKSLSINEQNRLKKQQIGCAYIDLLSYTAPAIRCDEIPCNRTATVICQKLPIVKTDVVKAKRESIKIPTSVEPSRPSTVTSIPSAIAPPDLSSQDNINSVGRDFAPIFFILAVIFALILLGFISTLYNHRLFRKNNNTFHTRRRNVDAVYSPLTSANEFDLN